MPGPSSVVGRWVHVFEEDDASGQVYRRVAGDLPLSRRPRERLELRDDGSAILRIGGPDDRPRERRGVWREEHDAIVLSLAAGPLGRASELRFVPAGDERLVLRGQGEA